MKINANDVKSILLEILRNKWFNKNTGNLNLKKTALKDYFNRVFNQNGQLDARVEKAVAAAVVKISITRMGMSKEDAMEAARQSVDLIRDVRAKKLFEDGKVTEDAYELYRRLTHSAWLRAAVKTEAKRTKKKMKLAWNALRTKPIMNKIAPVVETVYAAIPEEVKEKAKSAAKKLVNKAVEDFPKVVVPLVEKGYAFAKNTVEKISKGIEKAKQKGKEFLENHPTVKRIAEGVGRVVEKLPVFAKLKSIFA